MEDIILANIKRLKRQIPEFVPPAANYESFTLVDNLAYISGQLPIRDGCLIYSGKVGHTVSKEQAMEASEQCTMNIISQLNELTSGDLSKIEKIINITGYVACTNNFTEQHLVLNAASNLLIDIFGTTGRHARVAVGCSSLPLDAPVEIGSIVQMRI